MLILPDSVPDITIITPDSGNLERKYKNLSVAGSALASAITQAASGTIFQLGYGTFDLGSSVLRLPSGVSLQGLGKDLTTITSSVTNCDVVGPIIQPGVGSVISDLKILGQGVDSSSNDYGFGRIDYDDTDVLLKVVVERVAIEVAGMCVFMDGNDGHYSLEFKNCDMTAQGQGVRLVCADHDKSFVYLRNVHISVDGDGRADTACLHVGGTPGLEVSPKTWWIGGSGYAHHSLALPDDYKYATIVNAGPLAELHCHGVKFNAEVDDAVNYDAYHVVAETECFIDLDGCDIDLTKTFSRTNLHSGKGAILETQGLLNVPNLFQFDADGYGGGLAGLAHTTDITLATASTFALAYKQSGAVYSDLGDTSQTAGYTNDSQAFPDSESANDAVYLGHSVPFSLTRIQIATSGVYSGNATLWEYWNGSAWATLTGIRDTTDSTAQDGLRSLQATGVIMFLPPADWAEVSVNSLPGYWIRLRVTAANITTIPIFSNTHRRLSPAGPYRAPCTGYITGVTIVDRTTGTVHSNTVAFHLMNFTEGSCSKSLTVAASRRRQSFTGTTLHADSAIRVRIGDSLWPICTDDDGTNEMANVVLELTFQAK